jgi:alkylated DNA repair dioxygenase AlkB
MIVRPSGLYYYSQAVDKELYEDIIQYLDGENWSAVGKGKNSRKVVHYGTKYNYGGGLGGDAPPMPECIDELKENLVSTVDELIPGHVETFNQCIVNKYEPGQGISAHIDHPGYGDIIGCYTFAPGAGQNNSPGEMVFSLDDNIYNMVTEDSSLYIMTGESRSKWSHAMVGRITDMIGGKKVKRCTRISVTFRTDPRKR